MKTYKAIHTLKDFSEYELNDFSSLFSGRNSYISNGEKPYVCIPFSPDVYLNNKQVISEYFKKNYYSPLIMTNYKFLSLLLLIVGNSNYTFKDFSFKEEGEEGEHEKSVIEEMIFENKNVHDTFNFLESKDQTIKSIELEVFSPMNSLRIYSSGSISISNSFSEQYFPHVLHLIDYLFTGRNNLL